MIESAMSRRAFVAGAAASAAAVIAAQRVALASESKEADEKAAPEDAQEDAAEQTETINSSGIVVDPEKVTEVISTDILIVGGGLSGLAAAVQAAENGDKVIMIEAQETLGGNGQGVEGTFGVNTKFQEEQGITVDKSIIMQEELSKPQWCVNGLYYKDLINNSADNLEWLVDDCGCELSGLIDNYPFGATGGKVETFHWWKDGAAYVGYVQPMDAKARELGVDIRLNNRGLEFYYAPDGTVNGVYAQDAFGDLVIYQAKTIILATGGFANDDARLVRNGFDLDTLERIGMPGHYGDGINMAIAAGASEFTGVCYLKYNRISHDYSVQMFGPFYAAFCSGGNFLWVNEDLERFVDESCALRTGNSITQSAPIHNQPNCTCFSIFDAAIRDKQIAAYEEDAETNWDVNLNDQLQSIIDQGDDAWMGDTLDELAANAGVDADALKAAVEEYNAACEAGKDDWFGKDAEYLEPIETAPFYLTRIHEAMEGPLGGVKTDRTFRPQLATGGVMKNVFVIGLDGIMLYRDVYPIDVPGSASAECINGGRTAANESHTLLQSGEIEEYAAPEVSGADEGRVNAKKVIMAASSLFTTVDLGLTDEDSPATIAQSDSQFADFYDQLLSYEGVEGLDVTDCSFTVKITAVTASTARGDSAQTNYRYAIQSAEMTVNGAHVTYDTKEGLSVA